MGALPTRPLRTVALPILLVTAGAWLCFWILVGLPAERALEAARDRPVETSWARRRHLASTQPGSWTLHLADAHVLGLASLDERRLLVGTLGGAFLYDPLSTGRLDLPVPRDVSDSSVRAVASSGGQPVLGLGAGGVAWVGSSAMRLEPPRPGAGRIRAMAASGGRVWTAGAQGGLWWSDRVGNSGLGHPRHPRLELPEIRSLDARAEELLIGGGPGGAVWIRGDGRQRARVEDERVLAVALGEDLAWLGTELGVWLWRPGAEPRLVSSRESVTALAARGREVLVGCADGRLLRLRAGEAGGAERSELARMPTPIRCLLVREGRVYLGGAFGLAVREEGRAPEILVGPEGLEAGHVSALTEGTDGGLWVGHFRDGLLHLDSRGRVRERHRGLELWQVNRLLPPDPARPLWPGLLVATSRGVFQLIDGEPARIPMGEGEASSPRYQGMLADPHQLVTSGAEGVRRRGTDGRVDAVGAFHGLPSNKAYALAARGRELFVGTLAGLARLEDGRLARTWRPEASRLPSGWVQALAFGPRGLFVGTFGGGVAMLPDGELELRELEGAPEDVNPNAFLVHQGSLWVGSAGQGVFRFDGEGRLAGRITRGLPSWDVHALAATGRGLAIGTTNGVAVLPWAEAEGEAP